MVFFIWKPLQTFSLQIKFLKLRETCSISSTSCLRVSTVLVLFKLTIHCFLNRRTKTSGKLTFGRGETTLSWGETTVIQHVARGKLCGSHFFRFFLGFSNGSYSPTLIKFIAEVFHGSLRHLQQLHFSMNGHSMNIYTTRTPLSWKCFFAIRHLIACFSKYIITVKLTLLK